MQTARQHSAFAWFSDHTPRATHKLPNTLIKETHLGFASQGLCEEREAASGTRASEARKVCLVVCEPWSQLCAAGSPSTRASLFSPLNVE